MKSFPLLMSAALGFLMGVIVLFVLAQSDSGLEAAAHFLSYPGIRLGRLWTDAGLPPQGDAAFGVIALAILLQWIAVGFVVGLCWRRRR
ncbi:MAG TPA: hypothetical protein PLU30_17115 [Verrucomicrobiae bacterium]|nr:hypothetical protein [Verrucomicrobiae bacterium]